MSTTTLTSPLPARDIMSDNASVSPSKSRRTGRNRLSELLKPSPPQSRTPSPKASASNKAADVSSWSTYVSKDTKTGRPSPLGSKSKGSAVEVVIGTSPVRDGNVQQQQGQGNRTLSSQPRTSRLASSVDGPKALSQSNPSSPLRDVNSVPEKLPEAAEADETPGLQRSASDINLPDLRERSDTLSSQASRPSIRSAVSESGLADIGGATVLERPKAAASISKETKISRRQSITNRLRGRSKPAPVPLELKEGASLGGELAQLPKAILSPREQVSDPMEERPSTLTKMARRTSWIIGSRSPSPSNRKLKQKKSIESQSGFSARNEPSKNGNVILPKSASSSNVSQLSGSESSGGSRKSRRPLSAIITRSNSFMGGQRPRINIPKSMSAERLPTPTKIDEVPEMPKTIPKSKIQNSTPETPRRKDELWSAFRNLDAEFHKFSSKPSSLKAQVVRSGLLPFLKNSVDHPSTKSLRADDLDKRVNVLNKWWVGLLEMLNGRNGQFVSPNDRPAVLEGVTGIMTRPEWRLSLSTISSRAPSRMPVSRSASSLESSSSDFLAESVLHNVRNIFVQNLLSQMAFVIERMSTRSVPASIVNFCGRACAYAFFFCPGVAEILVRLWSPPPDSIRRVLKEAGALERNHDTSFAMDVLSRNFPAHLQPLAATSFPSLMRYLRSKPRDSIPLSSAYIPWNGPWVGRWNGRDTDLFFVFTKTAVSLISELLPENISQADWVCVPCAALIQAQLLTVIDATVHRGSSQDSVEGLPTPSFDDVLGADAVVHPLPTRAPNTIRIMAENRLITLLRECLFSQHFVVKMYVRRTFAHIFTNLIKATTRRVSLFDHDACFTLCDFLDEAFTILGRFYKDDMDPASWIDWPFWFDAFKKMGDSNNTMTEVRLFTFIYGMWPFLTKSEQRRKEICLDWLLTESYFDRNFNHWCPMVRAYYMRLLCWRVAREDGEGAEVNALIFETLLERTKKGFAWFLSLQDSARLNGTVPPSSAPSTPAPGRRLLIVRSDNGPSSNGQSSWDNLVAAASSSSQPYQRYSSLNPLLQAADVDKKKTPSRDSSPVKKGWFRKMNPFSAPSTPPTPQVPQSPESDSESVASKRTDAGSSEAMSIASKRLSTMSSSSSLMSDTTPRGRSSPPGTPATRPRAIASFKFSLEWTEKPQLVPRNRKVHRPQLPQLAQQLVDSRQEAARSAIDEENSRVAELDLVKPLKPLTKEAGNSAYCGRALVEWEMLVKECQGFYERRRVEGVTDIKWMETPTLGVESFRRPLG